MLIKCLHNTDRTETLSAVFFLKSSRHQQHTHTIIINGRHRRHWRTLAYTSIIAASLIVRVLDLALDVYDFTPDPYYIKYRACRIAQACARTHSHGAAVADVCVCL